MARALRIGLTTLAVLACVSHAGPAPAGAASTLYISSSSLISWQNVAPSVLEYTLRATLTNAGPPIQGATAGLTIDCQAMLVVDGELTFGAVGTGQSVPSDDTFTVRQDRTVVAEGCRKHWTITPTSGNLTPVANAGEDVSRRVTEVAQLDGSGSTDPDGDPLTYRWTMTARPAGSSASLSDPSAVRPTLLVDRPGTYSAQLIVNDGTIDSAPDSVSVTTENTPPVADAGSDQTSPVGRLVSLNGGASSDADGDPLSFAWRIVSAPDGSTAALSGATGVGPTFVPDRPGAFVVELAVHDGTAASAPDTVAIATENSAPVANAGADQTTTVAATVTLDGSGSTDVDGDALTFSWTFVGRPAGSTAILSDSTGVAPTFVVDRPGAYELQLVVNDGLLASAPDTVTVATDNSPPVADAGADQSALVGATATLDGSGSTDVDGDPLTYAWSLTTIPAGSAATLSAAGAVMPSFVVDLPGTYVAQLIVNDGRVSSVPDTVTVSTRNTPPTADAGPDRSAVSGQLVQLDGSGSSDVDGDPLSFRWALTSSPSGSTASLAGDTTDQPTLVVDQPGDYVVQLIVNDGFADSAPDTVAVTTANATPVANAGPDQLDVPAGLPVSLDGSASSDADGHALAFEWVLLARPDGSAAALANAATVSPGFTPDVAGDYIAQLIVRDGFVSSQPDTVLIRAIAEPPPTVTIEASDDVAAESGDQALMVVTRTGSTDAPLIVNYTILGGAVNGTDYQTIHSSVTIQTGSATAAIPVVPIDDQAIEQTERVELQLASGPGYTIGSPALAIVSIADNDLPVVIVTANDADASEAGPAASAFTVARTGSTEAELVVSFGRGGTAVSTNVGPQDYASIGQAVTIPAGASEATIAIVPLADNLVEGAETVVLTIQPTAAYVVGAPDAATVTIADDPAVVRIDASDPLASEAGADAGVLAISRTGGNTAADLTVTLAVGGTAVNNTDYALIGSLVTIPAGQSSATVTIAPFADNRVEGTETVTATIQPAGGAPTYTIGAPGTGTVTIADDPAVVGVVATDPDASEAGDSGVFTFTRSGGDLSAALLVFVSRSGTAANDTDYPSLGGGTFVVTIPADETSALVTITPVADTVAEPPETVILTISVNASYVIGDASATVTIADASP